MDLETAVHFFLRGYFATSRRSPSTLRAYASDLRQFIGDFCAGRDLASIRPRHLESWATRLQDRSLAPATIRRRFATLRVFFRYCVRRGPLDTSPLNEVELDLEPNRTLPRTLELREVRALLAAAIARIGTAPTPLKKTLATRDRALLEVLFASGLRIGEVLSAGLSDYQEERGTLRVLGKGRRERLAVLPDQGSLEALHDYLKRRKHLRPRCTALFLNCRGLQLSSQGAALIFNRLAELANLQRHLTPHMLRHTIATQLLEGGADIRMVQEFLGHRSISTTQRYAHVTQRHLRASLARFHPNVTAFSRASCYQPRDVKEAVRGQLSK